MLGYALMIDNTVDLTYTSRTHNTINVQYVLICSPHIAMIAHPPISVYDGRRCVYEALMSERSTYSDVNYSVEQEHELRLSQLIEHVCYLIQSMHFASYITLRAEVAVVGDDELPHL